MIADLGFALSTISYGLLLLLLFTVRKAGLAKYLLILATAATSLWSLSHINALFGPVIINQLLLFDTCKQLIWLVFLLSCIKNDFYNLKEVIARPFSMLMLAIPLIAIGLPFFLQLDITWRFLLQTVIALQLLVMLELIYRQAGEHKWAYKPLILYLGATNLFEFVTYANATMVGSLEVNYIAARGFIYAVLLPLLVLAIRRIKHWGVDIFISREIVLHSSLLMVAGGYLFIMAMAGYFVKYIGGQWGGTIQIVLIALSTALLMTLFLSNSLRMKIRVFITKHFFANQFDYRIEWLKLTESLPSNESDLTAVYRNALGGLMQAIDYNSGILIKKQGQSLRVVSQTERDDLSPREWQLLDDFSRYCEHKNWIIDIEELRYKPFVYEGLKVNHALLNECSFQIVLPIYKSQQLWGLALMSSDQSSRRLNWELRDYLSAVTAQVSSYVFHNEAGKEVAENAQFAAFNRMSAFVLHDLKNVLAQIDLILCNAEQHKDNPEFIDDTFETLQHTKARMDKMLRQLTDKNEAQQNHEKLCTVSIALDNVITHKCAGNLPEPRLNVLHEKQLVIDEEKFCNVMYHLISNAQQATPDDGSVTITVDMNQLGNFLLVTIADTGEGMSQDFIERRLFKPFDTTKGNAGMGIGAYDAKNFVEKIGGSIQVQSTQDKGSVFTLSFPAE
ncbi:XrtA/PEP-CTERM system histidine kinase PrsK [Aliiglaciecola sp. LCG003]|uniref:XrtA/PEP-CTERM system histidine kinase PrsK n=1 Tax=Aliiglaciecola sp. LCG003 TaxID=3053655 RepID=UPI002573362C|nr:XrtA/PEP-CTERM system histidine kinase PrsK [Aliiglaciecola sp. LCG003]WJG08625.1 PEP-CTERM system histidine kinase PrsK [Aliiglaciecola sp. LCG003]